MLKIALKQLGLNQKIFVEELQFLYEKQSRDLAFKRVLGEEIYTTPLGKSNYKIPAEHKSAWWGLSDDHLNAISSECSTGLKSSERDIFGWTPLHYAVTTGKRNQVIVSKSIPILADMAGRNPVHHAARCGDHEILEILLGTKIDKKNDAANKVESKGMLPLHLAAQSKNAVEVAKLLLPYTDDINLRDKWGRTALYLAAENGSRGIVGVLVGEYGDDPKAEINIECDYKLQRRTALHAAVASRHHSILAMIAGKDGRGLKWKDSDQKTALELAVANDCELSIAALVKVFESTHVSALEAHAPKRETALPSVGLEVPVPERARRQKSTPIEPTTGTTSRFLQQSEKEARHQSKENNETVKICHWEEALDMSVICGRRKALVKMIELSKGTSREETWALALRTAAKEGKEDILSLILGPQVQKPKILGKIERIKSTTENPKYCSVCNGFGKSSRTTRFKIKRWVWRGCYRRWMGNAAGENDSLTGADNRNEDFSQQNRRRTSNATFLGRQQWPCESSRHASRKRGRHGEIKNGKLHAVIFGSSFWPCGGSQDAASTRS